MSVSIPETINTNHLLSNDEVMRIIQSVPSSRDRMRLLSHSVVANAIVKDAMDAPKEEAKVVEPTKDELPWAVVDTNGEFVSGHTSRSKARAACDRSAGHRVMNVRNPNGKG